jgi:hypothetical protein
LSTVSRQTVVLKTFYVAILKVFMESYFEEYIAVLGVASQGLYEDGALVGTVHHLEGYYFVHSKEVTGASPDSLQLALEQWVNLRKVLRLTK